MCDIDIADLLESSSATILRRGDKLVIQGTRPLSQHEHERIKAAFACALPDVPVVVVDDSFELTVLRADA